MSASREKKNRQTLAAQEGYVDPKAQRLADEAASARKSRAMYGAVAVIFVVVAVLVAVLQSGVLQRSATAVTVNGEKFTPGQMSYYYHTLYNNIRSGAYYSYMGVDSSKSLKEQNLSDMAKMFLGVDSDEDMTWDAYLKEQAKKAAAETYAKVKAAKAEGMTLSEESISQMDSVVDSMRSYAKANGYSEKSFLKAVYGSSMTPAVFSQTLSDTLLAQQYQDTYLAGLTYTDEQLEAQYEAERQEFDRADYESILFNGTAPSTTDANGNTVPATDEAQEAATAAAQALCEEALARYTAGETLLKIAEEYDSATYNHNTEQRYYGSDVDNWVFDAARKEGDVTTVRSGNNWYLLLFHSCERPTYNVVNVRHILSQADTSALDTSSETYQADFDAIWAEAKAKADENLATWKAGEATAESFAALATEVSDDAGSTASGGLYSNVSKESSYVEPFLNWCFEEGRKQGDTGIVETSYGYHVMYLDSFGMPYWQQMVSDDLKNHDYAEWIEGLTAELTVEEGSGMKYVG